MPLNGYSTGRDISLNLIAGPKLIVLSAITEFQYKQMTERKKIVTIDGRTRTLEFPQGWEGSFTLKRSASALDDYIAQNEDAYYLGADTGTGIYINATIIEAAGLTQYRFQRCALKMDDGGTWKGDDSVTQKLSFAASRRKKVL